MINKDSKLSVKVVGTDKIMSEATQYLWRHLVEKLGKGKRILLFLSGGSAVEIYKYLTVWMKDQKNNFAKNLTVGLADERYGKVNHPDSNEKQIRDTGFYDAIEGRGGKILSILTDRGSPCHEVERYNELISQKMKDTNEIWAVLGIGPDGHTAGILPQDSQEKFKKNFPTSRLVVYYELPNDYPNPFKKRITLTPQGLAQIDLAVVVVKSQGKEEVLRRMLTPDEPAYRTPAVLLQDLNITLFTDLLNIHLGGVASQHPRGGRMDSSGVDL